MRCSLDRLSVVGLAVGLGSAGCASTSPAAREAPRTSLDALAPEPAVHIGIPAPPFVVQGWLREGPVEAFEPGDVYVVELWASWCRPCLEAMPQLSDLAEAYADQGLHVLGVNVMEGGSGPTRLRAMRRFVESRAKSIRYPIAYDYSERWSPTWLSAAGRLGLPLSFVVDRAGRIAWLGSPVELEHVVPAVLAGTWDLTSARDLAQRERVGAVLAEQFVEQLRGGDSAAAYELSQVLLEQVIFDQPEMLAAMARFIVEGPGVRHRDLDTAHQAAERACRASGWQRAEWIEVLSEVHESQGLFRDAARLQALAVEVADRPEMYRGRLLSLQQRL